MAIKTADLCDQLGVAAQPCLANWRCFGVRPVASGRVQTVRLSDDAALLDALRG